jgi:peptidoglycan hydrolase-like protein with peptidoglycan-binding domain
MRRAKLVMLYTKRWPIDSLVLLGMFALSCSPTSSRTSPPVPEPLPEVRTPAPPVVAPPISTPQFDPVVRQIQGILQERGYEPGPLDGVLGKKTKEALRRFQKDYHLAVTGEIDAVTKNALLTAQPPESIDEGGVY